ncbi:MAG TPA: Crp/Fnr family transcriptional regulator [Gallionellaceae bacterium]|jgi:CRP/FNR family transcriptional regulator
MPDSSLRQRLFERYPMLGDLPAAQLEALLQSGIMRLPAHAQVFDENQACMGFPLILSGSVRVIKAAPNGRELQLYRVGPGESCILSSGCLLGRENYHARGVAEQETELLVLPADVFRNWLGENERFRDYIFHLFSERLTDLMQLVSAVAFQKLDQRLAALLASKPNPLNITHQVLADELGSAREIVSRLLKNFAEQGWVRLGREQIDIIDAAALKRIASL